MSAKEERGSSSTARSVVQILRQEERSRSAAGRKLRARRTAERKRRGQRGGYESLRASLRLLRLGELDHGVGAVALDEDLVGDAPNVGLGYGIDLFQLVE